MADAENSELRGFAAGLRQDEQAVRAALMLPWSSGQVEGQVNHLKLVKRQGYGRAKGYRNGARTRLTFITIEDETGVANLILWPDRYARQRRLVLAAGMIACHGRVQRESTVIHVITDRLEDLSDLLRSVGERDAAAPVRHGRDNKAAQPAESDPLREQEAGTGNRTARTVASTDAQLRAGIKVPTRGFR